MTILAIEGFHYYHNHTDMENVMGVDATNIQIRNHPNPASRYDHAHKYTQKSLVINVTAASYTWNVGDYLVPGSYTNKSDKYCLGFWFRIVRQNTQYPDGVGTAWTEFVTINDTANTRLAPYLNINLKAKHNIQYFALGLGSSTTTVAQETGFDYVGDVWYYLEYVFDYNDGGTPTYEVYIDNVKILSEYVSRLGSSTQTLNLGAVILDHANSNLHKMEYSDLYLLAYEGTTGNTRLGKSAVVPVSPASDGLVQDWTNTGSTVYQTLVRQMPFHLVGTMDFRLGSGSTAVTLSKRAINEDASTAFDEIENYADFSYLDVDDHNFAFEWKPFVNSNPTTTLGFTQSGETLTLTSNLGTYNPPKMTGKFKTTTSNTTIEDDTDPTVDTDTELTVGSIVTLSSSEIDYTDLVFTAPDTITRSTSGLAFNTVFVSGDTIITDDATNPGPFTVVTVGATSMTVASGVVTDTPGTTVMMARQYTVASVTTNQTFTVTPNLTTNDKSKTNLDVTVRVFYNEVPDGQAFEPALGKILVPGTDHYVYTNLVNGETSFYFENLSGDTKYTSLLAVKIVFSAKLSDATQGYFQPSYEYNSNRENYTNYFQLPPNYQHYLFMMDKAPNNVDWTKTVLGNTLWWFKYLGDNP